MPELPEYMLRKEKPIIPYFAPEERLFRRVPERFWDNAEVELDAIAFPDMSVTRESLGPATSARWEGDDYMDWGVVGFRVRDVPSELPYQGAFIYRTKVVHSPNRRNYPHSAVKVYESKWEEREVERHVGKDAMPGVPREAQQEWREIIRRRCQIILQPGEEPRDA